jgi:hypothetical protein
VTTPFYEAKAWANGRAIDLKRLEPVIAKGKVTQLALEIVDPLELGRRLRVHVLPEGAAATEQLIDLPKKSVTLATDAPAVNWWVELLGDRDMVLKTLGTEAAPQHEEVPKPVAVKPAAPPPVAAPVVIYKPMEAKASRGVSLRPLAIVCLGLAAAAGGVGGYFGWQMQTAHNQLTNTTTDGDGRITSITQRRAYELDAAGPQQALIANALFATAGGLAIVGVVLFIIGRTSSDDKPVALVPELGGFSFVGQ